MNNKDSRVRVIQEFLSELRKLSLTGQEFLTILGNTKISNSSYKEIKSDEGLTYNRLVEIFYESPLTEADYEKILKSAQSYTANRTDERRKQQEEQLKNAVSIAEQRLAEKRQSQAASVNKLKSAPINPGTIPFSLKENTHPSEDYDDFYRDERDDYNVEYDEADSYDETEYYEEETDYYPDEIELFDENGDFEEEPDDFPDTTHKAGRVNINNRHYHKIEKSRDRYKRADEFSDSPETNGGKIVLSVFLALILFAISFIVRYYETGSFLIIDENKILYPNPTSYQELAERFLGITVSDAPVKPLAPNGDYYLLPKESDFNAKICTHGKYIFKLYNNTLYALEVNKGQIKLKGAVTREEEFASIFIYEDKLYAILTGEYIGRYYDMSPLDENGEGAILAPLEGEFAQPTVTLLEFNAERFDVNPVKEITVDGTFTDIIKYDKQIYLITDYQIKEPKAAADLSAYIPSYKTGAEEKQFIKFENIFLPDNKIKYSALAVITGVSDNGFSVKAAAGGETFWAYAAEKSLFIIQQNEEKSRILRYDVSDKALTHSGSFDVTGTVYKNGLELRRGIIRVASWEKDGSSLYIFGGDLAKISEVKNIAREKVPENVLFDDSFVYIITDKLYGINTAFPDNPVLAETGFAPVYSDKLAVWSEDFRLGFEAEDTDSGVRKGLRLSMLRLAEGEMTEVSSALIAENEGALRSPGEEDKSTMYYSSENSLICIPISYFNGISQIDKFVLFSYDENTGFSRIGEIVYYDRNPQEYSSVVVDNYLYTFWDDTVVSADTTDMYVVESKQFAMNKPTTTAE